MEFGLRADDGIELLTYLAGDRARPAGADLAHIDQLTALALAKVERGDTGRILDEPDNGKLPALRGQPSFGALRAVGRVGLLGDDAFPIKLRRVGEHLLPVTDQVLAVADWHLQLAAVEQFLQQSLSIYLGDRAEVLPVEVHKIEGVILKPALPAARKLDLKL